MGAHLLLAWNGGLVEVVDNLGIKIRICFGDCTICLVKWGFDPNDH